MTGITAFEAEEYLPPGTTLPQDGMWEVDMSYDFDIPDHPLEQVAKLPTKIVTTEHGVSSTTMVESVCGRCVRVDVAATGSEDGVKNLLRKTLGQFIDNGFVLLGTIPVILELNGVLGAITFFRKPEAEKPELLAMPAISDIKLIEDFDEVDAEFMEKPH